MDSFGCSNITNLVGLTLVIGGFIAGLVGAFAGNAMGFLIFFIGLGWLWFFGHMSS